MLVICSDLSRVSHLKTLTMACSALRDLILHSSHITLAPHSLCSTHTGLLAVLDYAKHVPTSGLCTYLLCLECSSFCQIHAWLASLLSSDLGSNVTLSDREDLPTHRTQ